jgi:hypothetical protein
MFRGRTAARCACSAPSLGRADPAAVGKAARMAGVAPYGWADAPAGAAVGAQSTCRASACLVGFAAAQGAKDDLGQARRAA